MTKLLMLCREPLPTFRADVAVLFGKYLPRLGVETDLYGLVDQSKPSQGMTIFGLRMPRNKILRLIFEQINPVLLVRPLMGGQYDGLIVRDRILAAAFLAILAKIIGKPMFYWMSFPIVEGYLWGWKNRNGITKLVNGSRYVITSCLLKKVVLPLSRHIFVQSDRMLHDMVNQGVAAERMTAVPMGVDLEALDPKLAKSSIVNLSGKSIKLVYLGSLSRARQLEVLVDLMKLLHDLKVNVQLLIIGDSEIPADRIWLQEYVIALNLQDIIVFMGWLDSKDAWKKVRECDIGLAPVPETELYIVSSPTKTLEYMAIGLPCIANRIPDQAKVLDESGAGLCVNFTAEAFADAVIQLVQDPVLYQRCAKAGLPYIQKERSYTVLANLVASTLRQKLDAA